MRRRIIELLGPIFFKEVVDIARRRRYYLSRVLYGLALLVVLVLVWLEASSYGRRMSSINAMAMTANMLFQAASMVQYAAVFLFVPLFVCGVIAGEREERTLELLFMSHLSDREIVLGKLASRVAAMACLILCGLPVMSIIMLQGGVAPESLWRVVAATLLAILFAGAHAVYFSVTTSGPLEALVRTYWWLGVWLVGVPLLGAGILDALRPAPWLIAFAALLFVNPGGAFVVAVDGYTYNFMAAYLGRWFFPLTFVLPAAWSVFLLWRAIRRLRATPVPALQRTNALLGHLWRKLPWPQVMNWRNATSRTIWFGHVVLNPMWLRARLMRIYDRSGHIGVIQWAGWAIALLTVVFLAVTSPRDIDDEECSMAFLGTAWAAVGLLTALIAGTSLVGDRRRGFLELVLVTPLTGREVVDGTFLAIWEHMRRLFWLPWALGLFFFLTGASPLAGVLASLITATLFGALLAWHGVACSLAARTVPAALTATFLFPVVTLGATALLIGIFEEVHGPVFWILCPVFLVAGWLWTRRHLNVASVASFLTALHLVLAGLAVCWTFDGRRDEFPLAAMHPGFLVIAVLDDRPEHWFRGGGRDWYMILPCYWAALGLNLVLARRWLIRHFDRLVERIDESGAAESADKDDAMIWPAARTEALRQLTSTKMGR
jgi:hypothetical protein